MVRAVPGVPDAPRGAGGPAPRLDGRRRAAGLHARRPGRHDRRLSRDPSGAPAADRAPDRPGPVGHRAMADPDGRVPRVGRDVDPEPRDRLARGRGVRRGDAGRLPAGHVRPRGPDAPDPAPGGDPPRRRLARCAGRDRSPRVHLALARRLLGPGRVPRRRIRQRRVPAGDPGPARRQGRAVRRRQPGVLRRPIHPRDVRHGPRRPVAAPRPDRRGRQRPARRHRGPDRDPDPLHPLVRRGCRRSGPA